MIQSFFKKFFPLVVAFGLILPTAHAAPEMITLNQKTSHYMNINKRITRIAVGSPEIATVIQLPGSASEFLVVTKSTPGSTALFVWTADGARYEYLITVSQEDPGQALMIEQAIGLPDVHVKMVGQRILLTGTVEDQYEKNYVLQTVRLFIGKASDSSLLVGSGFDMKLDTAAAKDVGRSDDLEASKSENTGEIIDLLQIRNPTQIRLEAQIVEINSEDAKALGLQYGTNGSGGIFSFGENYPRSHTTITENYSDNWSRNYSGDWSNSYDGGSNNSYTGGNTNTYDGSWSNSYDGSRTGGYSGVYDTYRGTSTDDYAHNYDTRHGGYNNGWDNAYNNGWNNGWTNGWSGTYNNGRNNDYSNSRNRSGDWNGGSNFSRNISVSYQDLVSFANNPLKWIGQHFAPVNMTLTALVTKGKAKILSRPSVMTLSGEQATIQIGGRIPYTSTNANGGSNTQFEDYGIILQFKPVVDEQKRINSIIHAEVSNLSGQAVNGQPIITTRSADSMISLYSGGTIVIGGLMDSSESKSVTKIPLLGDIPILGEFFKHTSKSRDKRELIILVTPHIIGYDEGGQTEWSPSMQQWYELNQKYRDTMTKVDFNKPKEDDEKSADEDADKKTEQQSFNKTGKETNEPFSEK